MDSLFPFLLHHDDDDHDVRDCGRDHDDHDHVHDYDQVRDHDHDRVGDHFHDQNACVCELHFQLQQVLSQCEISAHDYDHDHDDGHGCDHDDLMQNVRSQK